MKYEIAPKSTEIQANWDDARLYCFSLNIDGKTGWRLPTRNELNEIFQSVNDFDFRGFWYWSSTEYDGSNVWVQSFSNGLQGPIGKYDVSYFRAIRDLS